MTNPGAANSTKWVRHRWDLRATDPHPSLPNGYIGGTATAADAIRVLDIVVQAYGSDPAWVAELPKIASRMHHRIRQTLGQPGTTYLTVKTPTEVAAVSGLALTHWTDQNFLTGICVRPQHQRLGLGHYLLAASLQWLKLQGATEARIYTESGSLADRKIYPLHGSRRDEDVCYPGSRLPPIEACYTVVNNRYFDDRVQSLGLATADGYATCGVITQGQYKFTAEHEERVQLLSGGLRLQMPGSPWVDVPENGSYVVPRGTTFEVEAQTDVAYLCRYYPLA